MIPKFVFIVPYRNREPQKIHYEVYMKYILEDYDTNDYKIFFVHQCDERPFNRGAIKNIGFIVIKNLYPKDYKNITLIFNDIDTIPSKKNLLDFDTTHGKIKHYYGFKHVLGGIFSIKGNDFEKITGFPNLWGWGLEDNTILNRAKKNNLIIDYSNFYHIHDMNIINISSANSKKLLSLEDTWYYKEDKLDNMNDIKDLKYTIDGNVINVTNFITKINFTDNHYSNEILKNNKINLNKNFIPKNTIAYKFNKFNFK